MQFVAVCVKWTAVWISVQWRCWPSSTSSTQTETSTLCCLEKVLWTTRWPLCSHRKSNLCFIRNQGQMKVSLCLRLWFGALLSLLVLKFITDMWDGAAPLCIAAQLDRQTELCLPLLEAYTSPTTKYLFMTIFVFYSAKYVIKQIMDWG